MGDFCLASDLAWCCPQLRETPDKKFANVVTTILGDLSTMLGHESALCTVLSLSQPILRGKSSTIVGDVCEILSARMKSSDTLSRRKAFAEYLQYWMDFNGQKSKDVEIRSKGKGTPVSDATVDKLLLGANTHDVMTQTLLGLANGINRPAEEVFLVWIGEKSVVDTEEFQQSDFAHLWTAFQRSTNSDRKVFARYIQMLIREMLRS